ncbi:hypothetical protein [Williamsia sp.]|uniref:hypothetical protein n=1 Tax=Williamsia sp. TaxID=1872085 RepID=UPI002F950C44
MGAALIVLLTTGLTVLASVSTAFLAGWFGRKSERANAAVRVAERDEKYTQLAANITDEYQEFRAEVRVELRGIKKAVGGLLGTVEDALPLLVDSRPDVVQKIRADIAEVRDVMT